LDTSTIEGQYTGIETHESISDSVIESFVKDYNLSLEEMADPEFRLRSSQGPSGPAMASVCKEAKDLNDDLYNIIIKYLTPEQTEILNQIRSDKVSNPPDLQLCCKDTNIIRKITVVEDKEGKDRVIAILDY